MDILQDFIRRSFETHWEWMERYVDGLSQAEIEFRPDDQSHSIGFILCITAEPWICGYSLWPSRNHSSMRPVGHSGSGFSPNP